ncbi:MAG: VapC toxin family PIN domain ribonuclease, partial [Pseudomonadota bacterium]
AESQVHWERLRGLLLAGKVVGPKVHDARIAGLCLQHGVKQLWSADRDFGRFSEVIVTNPLVA